jgi:PPOX class probable F420-dependent enzyme
MSDVAAVVPESFRDLLEVPVATLATLGASGYPQLSQVWFVAENGLLRTSVHPSRQKYRNAVRHPQATFLLLDPANPQRYLEVRGDVTVQEDTDLGFLSGMLAKYGLTLEQFPAEKDNRKVLTLTPTRVRTWG